MIFQGILLIVIGTVLLTGLIKGRGRHRSIVVQLSWISVWTVAMLLVWKPEITSRIAFWVGIGRGSDLVFYSAIIILTTIVLILLVWVDTLDERITRLVQDIAIKEYDRKTNFKGGDSHPHI